MNDLLQKCIEQEHARITAASKPPPVPAKDVPVRAGQARTAADTRRVLPSARGQKRMRYVNSTLESVSRVGANMVQ